MRLPRGFRASGVEAGLKKGRPDVALIVAEGGANAAALVTRILVLAAPVVLSKASLKGSRGRVTGVVVNAGCANAVTGSEGMAAALRVQEAAAGLLSCKKDEVFVASTGVIGVVLPDLLIRKALPGAVEGLSVSGLEPLSRAILTTDVGPKVAQAAYTWQGRRGSVVGVAKGAGMIHPNMATMLAFLMTDAPASPAFLRQVLREANEVSFNAISVDGDTSTNDTVLLMASGELGGAPMTSAAGAESFVKAVTRVCRELAWKIVRDGEGASRVMEIDVRGARSAKDARLAAHAIATSPLVKTALAGGDANWGRILAAAGRSGARFSPEKTSLTVGRLKMVAKGMPLPYSEAKATELFRKERVPLLVSLGDGPGRATLLSCDLGHPYVTLNGDYRT
jgi:glutamate N-acetyltransferase/amino-acid N-acetyltransferase